MAECRVGVIFKFEEYNNHGDLGITSLFLEPPAFGERLSRLDYPT